MKIRFEAIPNPSCRFEIWDNETGEPVVHRDRLLTFASAKSAARIADFLNDSRSTGAAPAPPNGALRIAISAGEDDRQAAPPCDQHGGASAARLPTKLGAGSNALLPNVGGVSP
jgi:hypothetical protein